MGPSTAADASTKARSSKISVDCQTADEPAISIETQQSKDSSNEPTTSQKNAPRNTQTNPASPSYIEEGILQLAINDFPNLTDTLCSSSLTINSVPWRIMVMPKQHTTGKETQKCLAFFLQCCPSPTYNDKWTCQATAEMRLIAQRRGAQNFVRKTTHVYNPKENDWGYSCFMTWKEIIDVDQGYIKNGTVIVEICVKAEAPKNMLTKEEFLLKLNQWYRLAEIHRTNGRIDQAIEANQQALDYCKDKDAEMMKQLKIQKDALVAQKLVESIKRLEDGSSPLNNTTGEGRAAVRSAIVGPICTNETCRLHKARRQCGHLKKPVKPSSAQRAMRAPRAPCSSPLPVPKTATSQSTSRTTTDIKRENQKTPSISTSTNNKRALDKSSTPLPKSVIEELYHDYDQDLDAESEDSFMVTQTTNSPKTKEKQEAAVSSNRNTVSDDNSSDKDDIMGEQDSDECEGEDEEDEETVACGEHPPVSLSGNFQPKKLAGVNHKQSSKSLDSLFHAMKAGLACEEIQRICVGLLLPGEDPTEKEIHEECVRHCKDFLKWDKKDVDSMVTLLSVFKKHYESQPETTKQNEVDLARRSDLLSLGVSTQMAAIQCNKVVHGVEAFLQKAEDLFHSQKLTMLLQRFSCQKSKDNDDGSLDRSSMEVYFSSDDYHSTASSDSEHDEVVETSSGEEQEQTPGAKKKEWENIDMNGLILRKLVSFNQSMFTALGRLSDLLYGVEIISSHVEKIIPEKISCCEHKELQNRLNLRTQAFAQEQKAMEEIRNQLHQLCAQQQEAKTKVDQLSKQLRDKTNEFKKLEKKSARDDARINELVKEKSELEEKLKLQKREISSLKTKHSDDLKLLKAERDHAVTELEKFKKESIHRESLLTKEKGTIEAKLRQANAEIRDWRSADSKDKKVITEATSALENALMRAHESEVNALGARFEAIISLQEHKLVEAQKEVLELEAYGKMLHSHSAREQECSSRLESSLLEWKSYVEKLTSEIASLKSEATSRMEAARKGTLSPSKLKMNEPQIERPAVFRPPVFRPGVIGEQRNRSVGSPGALSPLSQTTKKRIGTIGERPTATVAPQTVLGNSDLSNANLASGDDAFYGLSNTSLPDVDNTWSSSWNPLESMALASMNPPPPNVRGYPTLSWIMPAAMARAPIIHGRPNMASYTTRTPSQQSTPAPMLPPPGYPLARYPTHKETEELAHKYNQ